MSFSSRHLWFFFILIVFIAGCAGWPGKDDRPTSIAVWDLENLSPIGECHSGLGEFLSIRVIQTLKETGGFNVIERERLSVALEELNLGTSSLMDESTRLRLGRLVMAELMIFGGYLVIADKMRLDLRLVEVESGRILNAVKKTVPAADMAIWLNAAGEATGELFKNH